MPRSARSIPLLLARAAAVAFALTACGYLVVTAQRRANPATGETPVTPVADLLPAGAAPANDAPFLPSSKVLVIDGADALTVEAPVAAESGARVADPAYLQGWKAGALPTTVRDADAPREHQYLYSSKSGRVSVRPELLPGTVSMDGTLPPPATSSSTSTSGIAAGGTAPPVEPVFLPSSKVKTQMNPFRPQIAPGSTTTTGPVFLPSSKSLRLGETKPPEPKPAPVPAAPPKNP